MRINPIMVKNHYSPTQKINFGMIENKKTEELTYNMMMEEVSWYSEEDKKDPDFGYKEAVEYIEEKFEYLKTSHLFTLKSTKYSNGDDVIYVTMNQEEVEKHEHKNLLYEMIDRLKTVYDKVRNGDDYWDKKIQKTGMLDEEGFLRILRHDGQIDDFYNEMQLREQGKRPEPPKPRSTNTTPSSDEKCSSLDDDNSYQAYIRYGV